MDTGAPGQRGFGVSQGRGHGEHVGPHDKVPHETGDGQLLDWEPGSIDALIFVTQTPDFRLPASACALQAELKLSQACIAFDINLGCSGYVYGLWNNNYYVNFLI